MNQNSELNDEIDLKDLFFTLWSGKIYIILVSLISVFLASFYLQSAERKYSVEYNIKPVGETTNNPSFSGLGGFASLAGIQLPTSSNNAFNLFKDLITSAEVSEIIFDNKKIIKDIFSSEWNDSVNNFFASLIKICILLFGGLEYLLSVSFHSDPNISLIIFLFSKIISETSGEVMSSLNI